MKKKLSILIWGCICFNLFIAGSAFADKKEEVMTLLQKGHDYIKANGAEKAAEAFTNKAEWWHGDLHIFAYNYKGDCIAHGLKPKKVGKNFIRLKSPEGRYHTRKLIDIAKKGGGWYEYRWIYPKTKKLAEKISYIKPIEGMDAFVGCGYWK